MDKIKIGIVGYGNIGRGVEQAIKRNDDMELAAVFTRRDPATVSIQTEGAAVKHFDFVHCILPHLLFFRFNYNIKGGRIRRKKCFSHKLFH